MDDKKKMLSDSETEKVTGGSHLSHDEVVTLKTGCKVIIEDDVGLNIAEGTYTGKFDDPGLLSFLRCQVRIDKLYFTDPDGESLKLSFGGEPTIRVGGTYYFPRWYLDFPERA